eukprot:4755233-Pyramimonas_sp.AAC.2
MSHASLFSTILCPSSPTPNTAGLIVHVVAVVVVLVVALLLLVVVAVVVVGGGGVVVVCLACVSKG